MQDGQFAPQTPPTPEYRPIYFDPTYAPARGSGGGIGFKDDPSLYEDAKIAQQSGFTNWTHTFLQGVNETQVGIGASDLMDGLVKKANLETKINQLDADYTLGSINQSSYLTEKSKLLTSLQDAYNGIQSARESIYEDKQDEAGSPISKAYQTKTQLTMLQGSQAGLWDKFKYSLPNVAGSSFATLGATLASGYFGKLASKAIQRGIAGSVTGPWGTALGVATGLATVFGINAYARNLESKAEVGSQFLQDYEDIRSQYLASKPPGYELTNDEENKLVIQASQGADDQYWKNMSLAVSDSIQSLIFAGAVGKLFRSATNVNKFTKLAGIAGEFYINKKLEGLEEGVQYAFQTDKSLAARGLKDPRSLGDALIDNFHDTISGMSFFGSKPTGPFAKDPEFQANVNAGELLGGLFGGVHSMTSIVKDVNSYYQTTQELSKLNPTKTDAPFLKFKDELYAQFFGPKDRKGLGLFSEESDDRVFFFKEGLKTLSKKTMEDGKPFLTKEELSKELGDIDIAYKNFQELNENLDSIMSPYGKKNTQLSRVQKVAFRNELFHNSMSISRLRPEVTQNQAAMLTAFTASNLNDLSSLGGQISVIDERLKNAFGNYETILNKEKKTLQKAYDEQKELVKSLGEPLNQVPIDQATHKAVNDYYDSLETQYDYEQKRKGLSKVKSWDSLRTWYEGYKKTASESQLKNEQEAIIADNEQYGKSLLEGRKPISELSDEDKKVRTKQNKETLDRVGFHKSYIDTLDENELDKQATKALEDFKNKVSSITDDDLLSVVRSVQSKDDLLTYLSRPAIRAAFNRLGFDINASIEDIQKLALQKFTAVEEARRKAKVRKPALEGVQKNTSGLVSGRVKYANDTRNTEEYEQEFNIKDGSASQRDVLQAVILSKYSNEAEKEIARRLLAITKDEDKVTFRPNWRPVNKTDNRRFNEDGSPASGDYTGLVRKPGTFIEGGEVIIDLGHFGDEYQGNQQANLAPSFEATVMHELIHKYTVEAVNNDPAIKEQINEMIKAAKEKADKNYYGLHNVYEFLTEAMTSPQFQRFLTTVEGKGNKTLWQQFIDAVVASLRRIFPNLQIEGSLLEDAVALTTNIIDGKKGKVNVINIIDGLTAEVASEFSKINPESKTAEEDVAKTLSTLQNKIINIVNENELGEAIKKQLLDNLLEQALAVENKIIEAREQSKIVVFQGKKFTKGDYTAIKGYPEPWYVVTASDQALLVGTKRNNKDVKTSITDVNDVEFTGNLEDTQAYLNKRDGKEETQEYPHNDSPHLYQSIGQEFDDRTGKFVEDNQPVTQRFYSFLQHIRGLDLAKLGYRGLVIQDDDVIAGFPIPRDKDTQERLKTKAPGQIVVVVDKDGRPIKFDQNFNLSESGEYVVFNLETPRRVMARDAKVLAAQRGLTVPQAEKLKIEVAGKIAGARKSASEGKPVFMDFKAVFVGVDSTIALMEVKPVPITITDAMRVIDLSRHLSSLDKSEKDKRQRVKDFLFDYIIGATEGSKISGGEIFVAGEKVERPTVEQIMNNFEYKKSFNLAKPNNPYILIKVEDGKVFNESAFPTYIDYLKTITNLASDVTKSRYNRYLTYEFAEKKDGIETSVNPDPTTDIGSIKKDDKGFFPDLFDSSLDISLKDQLEAEKENFKGLLGEAYKAANLEGKLLDDMVSQALDNKDTAERAFGKKAVEILYDLATFKQVRDAFAYKVKIGDTNGSTALEELLEKKGQAFDSSLDESASTNDLGLFDNQTTYELVKTLDKGIHNYLRRSGIKTIMGAMEDIDFIKKALENTKIVLLGQLEALKLTRGNQLKSALISQAYYDNQIKVIDDRISKINKNWKEIVEYHHENSYVFSFKRDLSYKYDEDGNLVQEGDDRTAREKGFDRVGNEISPIDGASKEIKALIRGLSKFKKVNNLSVRVSNSFNVPDLVNFAPTWNNLIKNLQGLSDFPEILAKIESLRGRFPEYIELSEILRSYFDKAKGGDQEARLMIAKFYRDFSNPEIPIHEILASITNEGTTFKIDEATRKNVKDLRRLAADNFRFKSKYGLKSTHGNVVLNPRILDLPTISKEERVEFLRGLGFEISEDTIKDPLFDVVASQQVLRYFKDELKSIMTSKQILDPVKDLSTQTAYNRGQTKRINDILDLESKYNETAPTLSMQNVEGNTEYAISRPNFYTTVLKGINDAIKYPTFQELVRDAKFAFLNKPNARTSIILNAIFVLDSNKEFGVRRKLNNKPVKLSLINISGLKVEDGEGNKTTSMFIGDKVVQDFNQLLKSGAEETARAGDKNTSYGLRLSTYPQLIGTGILPISDFRSFEGRNGYGGEMFTRIMEKYLHGEIMRIHLGRFGYMDDVRKMTEKKGKNVDLSLIKNVSLFQGLLNNVQKEILYASIEALGELEPNSKDFYDQTAVLAKSFIADSQVMDTIKEFLYNEVRAKNEALDKYGFNFNDPYWLDSTLRHKDAGTLLRAYIVNDFILHVEQTKLFNGDIVFYSTKDGEFHKRNPANGATGITPITDDWFVDSLNKDPNTNLQAKNLGVNNTYANVLKTIVFKENAPVSTYLDHWTKTLKDQGLEDKEIKDIISVYRAGSKEADAQGWITMDYYRSFKISIGDWRLAQERIYDKISQGQALTVKEMGRLGTLFPPIKAQYSGPLVHEYYHVPAFHKFSLMPLLPSAIKGTALESLNERMIRNNVSYALMESGSKVGTIGNNLEDFYQDRGARTMKDPITPFENENLIHTAYLKEQVQIEPELHDNVIFGTQFRKLLFQNVYSNGKPVNKALAKLEQEYSDIIDEITSYEVDKLTQDMGVEPSVNEKGELDYKVKDESKLLNRIREEVKRRKLNNSIRDFFELKDGKLRYPLDASLNHQQVRTLVLSMINNRLIRQTIKGDMLIQGSGLGFEKLQKPTDKDLLEYGTNGLRFYYVDGGKVRKMQVKTSLTGDFKHLLNFRWNGQTIGTLDRLNQALKDKAWVEENTKAITMIGYRIPTQGLNSIEVMEIAEFVPAEAGPILIVPTEIVTKAGSDFDIDKMNVFRPSLMTRKGEGQYIARTKYEGTKKSIKESINPQIEALQNKKKAFALFSALDKTTRDAFVDKMKETFGIVDKALIEQLSNIGRRLKELDQLIEESQQRIDSFDAELRASYNPDLNEILIAEKAYQADLKIDLADEEDKIQALKKNILLQRVGPEDLKKAEDLLDAMYAELFKEYQTYNDEVDSQIRDLINTRTAQLDQEANYKFGLYNRLIEVASERLTDASSFSELITPNNTDLIKPKVQEIAQKSGTAKKAYLHTNNLTSSTQEEKFLAGIPNKKALGIAAVANTFSQLFFKVGLQVNKFFKNRQVIHPMIEDFNMSNKYLRDGNLKSEIESQMINAYVDVLNDDFISKANLSIDTAGTFFYLLHLGHSKDQLLNFFNHPVIKAYVAELQKTKSILRQQVDLVDTKAELAGQEQTDEVTSSPDMLVRSRAKARAFKNVIGDNDSRGVKALRTIGIKYLETHKDLLSERTLEEAVSKNIDELSKDERLAVLSYYMNVIDESQDLIKLQQVNNYDTTTSVNPVANEFREALKKELNAAGLFNTTDVTTPTVIKPFNQFSLISNVLETLMPVSLSSKVRTSIVTLLEDQALEADVDRLTRAFINDWVYYVAANLGEVATGESLGSYGKRLLFGEQSRLGDILLDLKLNEKWQNLRHDFPIINSLRVDTYKTITNISLYREDNSTEYQNSLIEQLQKLGNFNEVGYSDEDKLYITKFFRNLAVLSFTQSGLNKSPISFTDVIPNEFYAPIMTKALEKFNALSKEEQNKLFTDFAARFRGNNTNLFGRRSSDIPYWRFKDYLNQQSSIPNISASADNATVERSDRIITRADIKNNPRTLYLFGDNDQRAGLGGQAKEMRGEPNTIGISTKKAPNNNPESFKTDKDFKENVNIIRDDVDKAIKAWQTGNYSKLVIPPIGIGLAKLPENAPRTFEFLQGELNRLASIVSGTSITNRGINTLRNLVSRETRNQIGSGRIDFQEDQSTGYAARTAKNASADATIAIAVDFNSAGEKSTKNNVIGQKKLYIPISYTAKTEASQTTVDAVVDRLNLVSAKSLNIAGNGIYTMKGQATQDQVDAYTYDLLNKVVNSPRLQNKITSIRTGGQTGFDEAGAKAGMRLGIPTTILAPKGWKFRDVTGKDISNEAAFKARFNNISRESHDFSLNSQENVVPLQEGSFQALLRNLKEDGLLSNECK